MSNIVADAVGGIKEFVGVKDLLDFYIQKQRLEIEKNNAKAGNYASEVNAATQYLKLQRDEALKAEQAAIDNAVPSGFKKYGAYALFVAAGLGVAYLMFKK